MGLRLISKSDQRSTPDYPKAPKAPIPQESSRSFLNMTKSRCLFVGVVVIVCVYLCLRVFDSLTQ